MGSRRAIFRNLAGGVSAAALMSLLDGEVRACGAGRAEESGSSGRPGAAVQRAAATSVIHSFMNGGPSQMDLFDPKPELTRRHGQEHFDRIAGEVEFPDAAGALLGSPFRFSQHGQCGMWVSELLPELSRHADDLRCCEECTPRI
ncbi:MAG UNVERIFIED_CONTAM: DUF1501 domain-containing protein [Planctomycetaceae bacterium]|jgi:hypothetical protein